MLTFALLACFSAPSSTGSPWPHPPGGGKDTGTTGTDTGTDTGETGGETGDTHTGPCDVLVSRTYPSEGAVDAYYRSSVEFTLSEPDPTAIIQTSIPGAQSTSADGLTVAWTPAAPLTPNTAYSATLHYCHGDVTVNFQTSDLGSPVVNPAGLVGAVYKLDLAGARWVEPAAAGPLLAAELADRPLYLTVSGLSGTTIDLYGEMGRAVRPSTEPDYCLPTLDFPSTSFTASPHVEVATAGPVAFTLEGLRASATDVSLSGDFSADGRSTGGGSISALVDTRALDSLFGGGAGALCQTLGSLGVNCQACGDTEPYCVRARIDGIVGAVDTAALIPIAGTDCAGCDAGIPADVSASCPQ